MHKVGNRGQSILKAIQVLHTVRIISDTGCSGPVVEELNTINIFFLTFIFALCLHQTF